MKWLLIIFSPILLLCSVIVGLYLLIPKFIRKVIKFLVQTFIILVLVHLFWHGCVNYFDIGPIEITFKNHQLNTVKHILYGLAAFMGFIALIGFIGNNNTEVENQELKKRLNNFPAKKPA